jgi:hypothetical protein
MQNRRRQTAGHLLTSIAAMAFLLTLAGCEKRKEKVIDIKAPGVSIEVERDGDSADVKIETDRDKRD